MGEWNYTNTPYETSEVTEVKDDKSTIWGKIIDNIGGFFQELVRKPEVTYVETPADHTYEIFGVAAVLIVVLLVFRKK